MFHCTAGSTTYDLRCTDTDHDTERTLPGPPVSCSDNALTQGLPGDLGQVCMSGDGTLYSCAADGTAAPAAADCDSRAVAKGTAGLSDCELASDGGSVACTYTGTDPACTDGSACPVQRTTVRCLVSRADGKYGHCRDVGELAPEPAGTGSVCEKRAADGSCEVETGIPLYTAPAPDHVTDLGDLELEVSPDVVGRGTTTNPLTGQPATYAEAVAACTGHEAECQAAVVSTLNTSESALAGMLEQLGLCRGELQCLDPNSPNGRKLQQWYRSKRVFALGYTAGSVALLTGLNSLQFKIAGVHFALAGAVGAGIFSLMLAVDKGRTALANRRWPATAAVDVAMMNTAIQAATATLQQQVNDLVTGRLVDRAMLGAQIADLENQLAALQPHTD